MFCPISGYTVLKEHPPFRDRIPEQLLSAHCNDKKCRPLISRQEDSIQDLHKSLESFWPETSLMISSKRVLKGFQTCLSFYFSLDLWPSRCLSQTLEDGACKDPGRAILPSPSVIHTSLWYFCEAFRLLSNAVSVFLSGHLPFLLKIKNKQTNKHQQQQQQKS